MDKRKRAEGFNCCVKTNGLRQDAVKREASEKGGLSPEFRVI
jgi:hypothetical protein